MVIRLRRQCDGYMFVLENRMVLPTDPDVDIWVCLNAAFAAFNRGSGGEIESFQGPSASIGDVLDVRLGATRSDHFMIVRSGFQKVVWTGDKYVVKTPLVELLALSEQAVGVPCPADHLRQLIDALQATYKVVCEGSDSLRLLWLAANAVAWEQQGRCNGNMLHLYEIRLSAAVANARKEIYESAEPAGAAVLVA